MPSTDHSPETSSNGQPQHLSRAEQLKAEREARRLKTEQKKIANKESIEDALAAERRAYQQRKALLNEATAPEQQQASSAASQQVIEHAQNLQQKNQSTLANTLRVAYETNSTADDTSMKLKTQTEQMSRMDRALDDTNASITRSDRTLRGLKGIGGRISNYFSKAKTHKSNLYERPGGASASNEVLNAVRDKQQRALQSGNQYGSEFTQRRDKVADASEYIRQNGIDAKFPAPSMPTSFSASGLDDPQEEEGNALDDIKDLGLDGSAPIKQKKKWFGKKKVEEPPPPPIRERVAATGAELDALQQIKANTAQEDEQLDELSDVLKQLQMKAGDMNRELKVQNGFLEHIDEQTGTTVQRIKHSNAKIKSILS